MAEIGAVPLGAGKEVEGRTAPDDVVGAWWLARGQRQPTFLHEELGIPVCQAVRPNSRNVTVSLGKGLTRAQAKVSALMESLEGFHAEETRPPVVRDTVRQSRYLGSHRAISRDDRLGATKGKT